MVGDLVIAGALATTITAAPLPMAAADGAQKIVIVELASEGAPGLGLGVAELLRADLARVPGLRVGEIATASPLERTTSEGRARIAARHDADFVLTGRARLQGSSSDGSLHLSVILSSSVGDEIVSVERDAPLGDFVGAEKAALEAIVDAAGADLDLDAWGEILFFAPTERFEAFAAWSAGLAALRQGQQAHAGRLFMEATRQDPEFEEARARAIRAEITPDPHVAIMAVHRDERRHPSDFVHTDESLAGFALRLMVLEREGLHCQRYEEMLAHLDRTGWDVGRDVSDDAPFPRALAREAVRVGFDGLLDVQRSGEAAHLFSSTARFLFDGELDHAWRSARGVLASMRLCFGPASQLGEIDRMIREVEELGIGGETYRARPTFTVRQGLELAWVETRAASFGTSDALDQRIRGLSGLEGTAPSRLALSERVASARITAARTDVHRARRRERSPVRLRATVHALAEGDTQAVRTDSPFCAHLVERYQPLARRWVREEERIAHQLRENREDHMDGAALLYGPLADMGCLSGESGRFATGGDVVRFLSNVRRIARPDRADRPECRVVFEGAARNSDQAALDLLRADPEGAPRFVRGLLELFHLGLVRRRCVQDAAGPRIASTIL